MPAPAPGSVVRARRVAARAAAAAAGGNDDVQGAMLSPSAANNPIVRVSAPTARQRLLLLSDTCARLASEAGNSKLFSQQQQQ